MKINFKTILIIFLVALLGGAAGTYGVLSIKEATDTSASINRTTDVQPVISEVSYSNESSGAYVTAIDKALDTAVEITTDAEYTSYNFFGGYSTSNATFLGSGVIISEDGYIVTNKHVVNQAKDVSVRLQNGDTYEATIIGVDNNTDLALLKIEASGLSYAKLADSDELKLGQEVIAIGNALGNGTSCSNGIISAINREVTIKNYTMTLLLTNAELNSGNSGGGLFDMNGNLVGIVNAKTSSSAYSSNASIEGIGYAIPSNTVRTSLMNCWPTVMSKTVRHSVSVSILPNTISITTLKDWSSVKFSKAVPPIRQACRRKISSRRSTVKQSQNSLSCPVSLRIIR